MALGNLCTSVDSMQVGDMISCEYAAAPNVIGVFSNFGSATKALIPIPWGQSAPNGSFNFIMVGYDTQGRKKLVADRNIQHSISFNTLNAVGLICGAPFQHTVGGVLTSSSTSAFCSSYSSGFEAYKCFDGNLTGSSSFAFAQGTLAGTIGRKLDSPVQIKQYIVACTASSGVGATPTRCPKSWVLEGSNDTTDGTNGTWDAVSTVSNETSWATTGNNMPDRRVYSANCSKAYSAYRMRILSNNGDTSYTAVTELQFLDPSIPDNTVMCVSTSREWTEIISNSTLGSRIVAGDTGVWNQYGSSLWGLTSTLNDSGVVVRGNALGNDVGSYDTSNASAGYRPVLLVPCADMSINLVESNLRHIAVSFIGALQYKIERISGGVSSDLVSLSDIPTVVNSGKVVIS